MSYARDLEIANRIAALKDEMRLWKSYKPSSTQIEIRDRDKIGSGVLLTTKLPFSVLRNAIMNAYKEQMDRLIKDLINENE